MRLLFPQFDIEPIRIDFGMVLEKTGPSPAFTDRFSSSFGQVTDFKTTFLQPPVD